MIIENATMIVGIILGGICLLAAVYNHIKHQNFGLGGVVLVMFGSMLLALSIWGSVEIWIGDSGAKFQLKEDFGAEKAELNNQLEELRLRLTTNRKDIDRMAEHIPRATISPAQEKERRATREKFERNSHYSILIFNKAAQQENAKTITKDLLEAGFKTSATETDLEEAKQQFPTNVAWVVYTERGERILPEVRRILSQSTTDIRFEIDSNPVSLRRGDIQVLLF
ncbi:hypothetical protein ACJJIG_18480 [Microbulbifer sp. SSSA007]|uniref:hypothetical protein n=1 Tax=unclassified Microbulbifer TaxID=2619833 RepID=UPI004039AF9B